jgi:hypothetical protein
MQTITINRKQYKIRACVVDAIQHFRLWADGETSTVRGTFEAGRGRNRHNDIAVLGSGLTVTRCPALAWRITRQARRSAGHVWGKTEVIGQPQQPRR